MKITRLGPPRPVLNAGFGGSGGGTVPGGGSGLQVLTSDGSNGRYWGENVRRITSNGSNILLSPDVNIAAGSNVTFAIASNTLFIHGQGGFSALTANGSNSLTGTVNLQAGAGIALGVVGQTITISSTVTGGGGGAGAFSYFGHNFAGGSSTAGGTTGFAKLVTLQAPGAFMNIGAYVSMTTLSFTTLAVAIYADSGGSPVGAPLAVGSFGDAATTPLVGASPVTPSWIDVPIVSFQPAGDYWILFSLSYQGTNWKIYYDGSGSDKEVTMLDAAGSIEGIYRTTLASAGRKYSIRALVLM